VAAPWRPSHRAGGAGAIQQAGATAHHVERLLRDRVGQRERQSGEECRHADLEEHWPQVEPHFGNRPVRGIEPGERDGYRAAVGGDR
jgi:hypothetical protein